MKRILSVLYVLSLMVYGCKEDLPTGEVLFCTNSAIINCPFSIEVSIDNRVVGTLSASSEQTSLICSCPESHLIGMQIVLESGNYSYYAKELNCQGTNRINEWSGSLKVEDSSCEIVHLEVLE